MGSVTVSSLHPGHESTRLCLVPKIEITYAWTSLLFSGRAFYHRYPSHSTDEQKWCPGWNNKASEMLGFSYTEAGRL
ncbi:hypothetical protein C0J52_05643 [Blattella germanica]|nr:hypothetical protein C0J52_05643 [Blattella germanica]